MTHKTIHGELRVIIYQDGRPFDVVTDTARWDFEWCARDQTLYRTDIGGGAQDSVHVHPTSSNQTIWVGDGVDIHTTEGDFEQGLRDVPKDPADLGYEVHDMLPEDPFNISVSTCGDGCYYCTRCEDWMPGGDLCKHLWWCATCQLYGGSCPDAECDCRVDVVNLRNEIAQDFVPWFLTSEEVDVDAQWLQDVTERHERGFRYGAVYTYRRPGGWKRHIGGEITIWSDGSIKVVESGQVSRYKPEGRVKKWLFEQGVWREVPTREAA